MQSGEDYMSSLLHAKLVLGVIPSQDLYKLSEQEMWKGWESPLVVNQAWRLEVAREAIASQRDASGGHTAGVLWTLSRLGHSLDLVAKHPNQAEVDVSAGDVGDLFRCWNLKIGLQVCQDTLQSSNDDV